MEKGEGGEVMKNESSEGGKQQQGGKMKGEMKQGSIYRDGKGGKGTIGIDTVKD